MLMVHAVNEHQDLRKKYADECYERKQLYNKVLELKGGSGSFVLVELAVMMFD